MKNVEILDRSEVKTCYICNGIGHFGYYGNDHDLDVCKHCNGTGKWVNPNYILIADSLEGKIAFQVDQGGK